MDRILGDDPRRNCAGKGASRCAPTTAALIFLLTAAVSAAPAIDITAKVDRSEITIGDRILYEIDVTYPSTGHVELPAVLGNLGAFEVKDYHVQTRTEKDGRSTVAHLFTISTFTVGGYALPPQRVEYYEAGAGGQPSALIDTTVLYTQPTEIKVKRTSPENEKDIADIADVTPVSEPVPWGVIALAAIALALIGYFLWKRKVKATGGTEEPMLPPYEEAVKRLRELREGSGPLSPREFAFALSEILRNYVGRRYGIEALESTTHEFLKKAEALPLSSLQQDWLREFCGSLDPMKYATAELLPSEAGRLIQEMEGFAEQTKPAPQPAGEDRK